MKASDVQTSIAEGARGFSKARWGLSANGIRQTLGNALLGYKAAFGKGPKGPGRGHHGHVGRPGKQGGSSPGNGGQCYVSAAKWVMAHPEVGDARLAHGTATGTRGDAAGQEYGHAWVEIGPYVLDTESGWLGSRSTFYTVGRIRDVARYDEAQLRERLLEFETWGPWGE